MLRRMRVSNSRTLLQAGLPLRASLKNCSTSRLTSAASFVPDSYRQSTTPASERRSGREVREGVTHKKNFKKKKKKKEERGRRGAGEEKNLPPGSEKIFFCDDAK